MKRDLRNLVGAILLCVLFTKVFLRAAAHPADVSTAQQAEVILGILEDHPPRYVGYPYFWRVRAVFEKKGNEWQAFPNPCHDAKCLDALSAQYPKTVSWTIAFDGRNLGQVAARTMPKFLFYDSVGYEEITSAGPVPTVGKRSSEFSGFLFDPVYRPLVAVSKPNFKDPENWKPTPLPPEILSGLRQQFRKKFPKVLNCKDAIENTLKPWPYRDEDIKVGKTYSSKGHWSLAELYLTGWACDGPQENDSAFESQWYAVGPKGEFKFLESGMWLLDAGDYEGDGKSEVLFAVAGYDLGGYRLYYRDFTKSAEFLFGYH